jgi:hypothetical protein
MPTISFDGPNKIIDVGFDAATTTVDAVDLYSRWKDWVTDGNAQFPPAFDLSVGGNSLGGGVTLDAYLFLRNDLGWRIRPADQDHILIVEGQLYGANTSLPVYLSRPSRSILVKETQSSRSTLVTSPSSVNVVPVDDVVDAVGERVIPHIYANS